MDLPTNLVSYIFLNYFLNRKAIGVEKGGTEKYSYPLESFPNHHFCISI